MKQILGVILLICLLTPNISAAQAISVETQSEPSISEAAQIAELEAVYIGLLQQLVTLLQQRLTEILIANGQPVPTVLSASTSIEEPKKRRGGGGGGSSTVTAPIVVEDVTSAAVEVIPAPTCEVSTDTDVYVFSDDVLVMWTSTNASSSYFQTDFDGKDYLVPPGAGSRVATSGTSTIEALIHGNPSVVLHVLGENGEEITCQTTISVSELAPTANSIQAQIAALLAQIAQLQDSETATTTSPTVADLQAQINALLAQLGALNNPLTETPSICPHIWFTDLELGSVSPDVKKLQEFLNRDADTRVAVSGPGAPGNEHTLFDAATEAAVSKFQVKYRSEILTPLGLVNATGVFDQATISKANMLCAEDFDDTSETTLDFGHSFDDPEEITVYTSTSTTTEFTGFVFEMETEETPVVINRASIGVYTDDISPNNVIDTLTLKINNVWYDAISGGSCGDCTDTAFFNFFFPEGIIMTEEEEVDVAVIATIVQNNDSFIEYQEIEFFIDDNVRQNWGVTLLDGSNEDVVLTGRVYSEEHTLVSPDYEPTPNEPTTITTEQLQAQINALLAQIAGLQNGQTTSSSTVEDFSDLSVEELQAQINALLAQIAGLQGDIDTGAFVDELIVKSSTNNPDATTLFVEENQKSDAYTIFTFDLDTDDSVNDVELDTMQLAIVLSTSTFTTVVDDVELHINGDVIDDFTISESEQTTTLDFAIDGAVVIEKGDRIEVEVITRFNAIDHTSEPITIQALLSPENAASTTADTTQAFTAIGAAAGETHKLQNEGLIIEPINLSETLIEQDTEGSHGVFEIEIEVTAFEDDFYIDANTISFSILDTNNNVVTNNTTTATLTSTADEIFGYFEIQEGDTEIVELSVEYTPIVVDLYQLSWDGIFFSEAPGQPNTVLELKPSVDFRTDFIAILN